MAYTILKSNGTVLTTIPDGTINTTSTSLGLPGRNFAGYGQATDENFVYLVENFARATPPAYPLTGQLWYNTNNGTLNVCPASGTTDPALWVTLASTSSTGNTSFGNVTGRPGVSHIRPPYWTCGSARAKLFCGVPNGGGRARRGVGPGPYFPGHR